MATSGLNPVHESTQTGRTRADRPKVLLVDDRAENLVALAGLLRQVDADLLKAESGRRALELLLDYEVAVAIVDVQMPELDGFELAELMRGIERTRHIPIVFVTAGLHDQSRVFRGYEAGAVDFLVKPLEPQILLSKVNVFLQLHRHKAQLADRVTELERALAERQRAQERLAQDNAALRQLHELSRRLLSHDELEPLLEAILDAAISVADANMGTLHLYDDASKSLLLVASHGFERPFLDSLSLVRDCPAACTQAARTGARVVVEDIDQSPIFADTPILAVMQDAGVRAVQSTVMHARDRRLLGVISTHWTRPHRPEDSTLRLLDLLSRQAADLIEYRRREKDLEALNARLLEEGRRKNEFLAVLSHELRNPLAPIKNSLFILDRAAPGGAQARRAKEVIDRQVEHLKRLVDDLLDVTRVTRNKVVLRREPLSLNELVQRVADDQRTVFERCEVRLDVELEPVPLMVDGDSARLAQVISNLLQNAAKFTARGGATRLVVEQDPQTNRAVLRVHDTGVGMTPQTQARLFEPFMQADTSLDRSKGGLGLGLALARALVDLHGGEIHAYSEGLGKGSTFVVALPLAHPPSQPSAPPCPKSGTRRRVLVIEDNADSADSLREALELDEHQVEVAYDGRQGIAKAREFRPEIVLCDIGLPEMDGYEVARTLRDDEALRHTCLVALTGYGLPEEVKQAENAGFHYHLTKPLSLEKLEALMAEVQAANRDGRRAARE